MGNICSKKNKSSIPQSLSMPSNDHVVPLPLRSNVFIALYEYTALSPQDLSFKKGEPLEIIKSEGQWWKARSLHTNRVGFVPFNFIQPPQSDLANLWFFPEMKRQAAEVRLKQRDVKQGGFLVRHCESQPNYYALSIRYGQTVKHYRIRKLDSGGFYISLQSQFDTLIALVMNYRQDANGLCCRLGNPCLRAVGPTPGIASDVWEVPRNSIKMIKKLGAGNFGEVWSGKWNENTDVAVKKMKVGAMKSDEFLGEAAVMKKLRHDHLIQLLAVCSDGEPILIITELMEKGNLLNFLNTKEGRALSEGSLINMSAQIASGMEYLEKKNYIHRDLAARNILVNKQNVCKVADFGLARLVDEDIYSTKEETKFPIRWTALEAILHSRCSIKSDVWSFGILLYEVITKGKTPYPTFNNKEVIGFLQRGERMGRPECCPEALHDLMLACWKFEPEDRPTFEYLHNALEDFGGTAESSYNDA